jgi:hypothetical protein
VTPTDKPTGPPMPGEPTGPILAFKLPASNPALPFFLESTFKDPEDQPKTANGRSSRRGLTGTPALPVPPGASPLRFKLQEQRPMPRALGAQLEAALQWLARVRGVHARRIVASTAPSNQRASSVRVADL